MLYGAYGYTGELVAREAVRRGLRPVLAGRRREPLAALAAELDLPCRSFGLEELSGRPELLDVAAVLHCAGPFLHTSRPMVQACLAAGVHYLDITGEIVVFEAIFRRDEAARVAGLVLLPGAGFDVVPTDCLAKRLAEALPDADRLELAFTARGGGTSRGTLRTIVAGLPHSGAIRRQGRLEPVPLAWEAREIEFGCGRRWAMTIPWGDLATAYRSTGIPDIRVYTGTPRAAIRRLRRLRPLLPVAGTRPVKGLLDWWVRRTVTGPDEARRAAGRSYLWGRVRNPAGAERTATLETPEGYTLTAAAAVECVERVVAGAVRPGAWTPSLAFGAGFVEELPGVEAGPISGGS